MEATTEAYGMQQVKDAKFPDIEVVRSLWDVLMEAIFHFVQVLSHFHAFGGSNIFLENLVVVISFLKM